MEGEIFDVAINPAKIKHTTTVHISCLNDTIKQLEKEEVLVYPTMPIKQDCHKISLGNLCINMLNYLRQFFNITDLLQIAKINKRIKTHLFNKNLVCLKKLLESKPIFDEQCKFLFNSDHYYKNDILEKLYNDLKLELPETEINNIFVLQCNQKITKKLILPLNEVDKFTIKLFKLILESKSCPYEEIYVKNCRIDYRIDYETSDLFAQLLNKSNKLRRLTIDANNLKNENIHKIISNLNNSSSLNYLTININYFVKFYSNYEKDTFDETMKLFIQCLEKNTSITHLYIEQNKDYKYQYLISEALSKNKGIKTLQLYYDIDNFDFLRKNSFIETLIINFSQEGVKSLSQCLNKNFEVNGTVLNNVSNVKNLVIELLNSDSEYFDFTTLLLTNDTITYLEIPYETNFFDALSRNTSIKVLSLDCRNVKVNLFTCIEFLPRNIEHIIFFNCTMEIFPNDVENILYILESNLNWIRFDLEQNSFNLPDDLAEKILSNGKIKLNCKRPEFHVKKLILFFD